MPGQRAGAEGAKDREREGEGGETGRFRKSWIQVSSLSVGKVDIDGLSRLRGESSTSEGRQAGQEGEEEFLIIYLL